MKRILLLILSFLFLFTCTSFATDRWQWAISTSLEGYFFDTQSIRYKSSPESNSVDKSIIIIYIKEVYGDEMKQQLVNHINATDQSDEVKAVVVKADHSIDKYKYDINRNSFKKYDIYFYDENDVLLSHKHYDQPLVKDISPESLEEKIFNPIVAYVKAHDAEITARTNGSKAS
jgi:hypothetical protein